MKCPDYNNPLVCDNSCPHTCKNGELVDADDVVREILRANIELELLLMDKSMTSGSN